MEDLRSPLTASHSFIFLDEHFDSSPGDFSYGSLHFGSGEFFRGHNKTHTNNRVIITDTKCNIDLNCYQLIIIFNFSYTCRCHSHWNYSKALVGREIHPFCTAVAVVLIGKQLATSPPSLLSSTLKNNEMDRKGLRHEWRFLNLKHF